MDSFYDQFAGEEAPQQPQQETKRDIGWQANREDNTKPYVNKEVRQAPAVTQPDLSYYAFTRFALGHPPRDTFESSVNSRYKKLEKGFDFAVERAEYINFYRGMMGEL